MSETDSSGQSISAGIPKYRMLKGCLTAVFATVLLTFFAVWQAAGPSRRAHELKSQISVGLELSALEDAVKKKAGRHYIFYEIEVGGAWKKVGRDEFVGHLPNARINLVLLGYTPRRASLLVEIDKDGKVSSVKGPHGWD